MLPEGENIDIKNITGKWYGTSTYGFDYLGIILEASYVDNKLEVSLSFYAPDRKDTMIVKEAKLEKNRLVLKIFDSLRNMNATIKFSLHNNQMTGILESPPGRAGTRSPRN